MPAIFYFEPAMFHTGIYTHVYMHVYVLGFMNKLHIGVPRLNFYNYLFSFVEEGFRDKYGS
jgi:hypothetical protein